MHRRAYLGSVAGLGATAIAGCIGPSLSDYDIGMQSNAFLPDPAVEGSDPPAFAAAVGETVVWGNSGSRNHTVTAYDEGIPEGADYFASGGFEDEATAREAWEQNLNGGGIIEPGATYEHTFEVPGEYYYFCIPHEAGGMVGKVVVTE
jgi:plastocyanin